jgi:glycosyltransferase involved in cell wall biosynthesis
MRVLYVNHTDHVSGAERSLLSLLGGLPADVQPVLACPEGDLTESARALGVPCVRSPGTAGSLKLHPVHTTRAAADLARAAWVVRRAAAEANADVVHANSIRAGLAAIMTARLGGPPVVAHIRDCLPPGRATDVTRQLISRGAALLIANSHYTKDRFLPPGSRAPVHVIYNPVNTERFDPDALERSEARERLGLAPSAPVLAVVAQLTPWKAQADAIRILAELKPDHPDARLLLVGSAKFVSSATRYDNPSYVRALRNLVASLGLADHVVFMGERDDVPQVLRAIDVLLVPSWEEPFGRAIVEAMAMETPVVATTVGGPAEILRDGEDGLLVPPRQPERWVRAVRRLIEQPELRMQMGRAARGRSAERFSVSRHVREVLSAYDSALSESAR